MFMSTQYQISQIGYRPDDDYGFTLLNYSFVDDSKDVSHLMMKFSSRFSSFVQELIG